MLKEVLKNIHATDKGPNRAANIGENHDQKYAGHLVTPESANRGCVLSQILKVCHARPPHLRFHQTGKPTCSQKGIQRTDRRDHKSR